MVELTTFRIINIGVLGQNKFWGETERLHPTSATCTLLERGGRRLLVDPSPHPPELRQLLFDRSGLQPEAIDQVFVTHWHGDHYWGIGLFEGVPWLMAAEALAEWRSRGEGQAELSARFLEAEGLLMEGIDLYPSPGHTWGHCSLTTDTPWGRLIVAGDAAMTPEHLEAEEGYHNAVDFALSAHTIRELKAAADLLIPGHANLMLNLRR